MRRMSSQASVSIMDNSSSSTRQPVSGNKLSDIDVSQLDKINAIPNKTTDNVLMDGLCQEDQLYLTALMDEDSSGSDGEERKLPAGSNSAWSPIHNGIHNPVMRSKRMRKMRPSYAITLSLEDISYIRPSWGLSKGIKRIEVNKVKRTTERHKQARARKPGERQPSDADAKACKSSAEVSGQEQQVQKAESKPGSRMLKLVHQNQAYYCFLVSLIVVVVFLIGLSQLIDHDRSEQRMRENRLQVMASKRMIKIFKPTSPNPLIPLLDVHFGSRIPLQLKPDKCSCDTYNRETARYNPNINDQSISGQLGDCYACLDWAMRANLQIYVKRTKKNSTPSQSITNNNNNNININMNINNNNNNNHELSDSSFCYNFRWQSYDALATPLRDCFHLGADHEEQWFGLGDIQQPISSPRSDTGSSLASSWILNKLGFSSSPLITNLSSEFAQPSPRQPAGGQHLEGRPMPQIKFGSQVKLQLFGSSGVSISNLRSDFIPSVEMQANRNGGAPGRMLCLSVECGDRCGRVWSRLNKLEQLRYENNVLHYSICSDSSWQALVARQFSGADAQEGLATGRSPADQPGEPSRQPGPGLPPTTGPPERLADLEPAKVAAPAGPDQPTPAPPRRAEKIGLIERTIFVTSQEFMPALDGQTLRQYVDTIVRLGLKTSPILLVDTRWQTHVGSLKLNTDLFPKAKLLFDILHNKGFKIVLSIKPYIDASIGISSISQLLESNRLYVGGQAEPAEAGEPGPAPGAPADQQPQTPASGQLIRRESFFKFRNESVARAHPPGSERWPYLCRCREASEGQCVLIDVSQARNRLWLRDAIRHSSLLSQEADAIQVGGAHPNGLQWDLDYRDGLARLIDELAALDGLYTLPQWTGNFRYVQLAPRPCTWEGLRSLLGSLLGVGASGFALVHPGSVWGDLAEPEGAPAPPEPPVEGEGPRPGQPGGQCGEELATRWLQVAVFLPILQFNNLRPLDQFGLHQQLQALVLLRRSHLVGQLRRHLPATPLVQVAAGGRGAPAEPAGLALPLVRPSWLAGPEANGTIISEQFQLGPDLVVAPVLSEGQRAKDIYLPSGFWRDELRQTNVRGGKWLRNYRIELNEVAWFRRASR